VLEHREGEWNKPPIIQEEAVNDLLCHLDTYKSMGPNGIHPRVLRELAEEMAKPLSIICQQSWLTGEVPGDWRIASVTPIYKKGWKEDPRNYRPVSWPQCWGRLWSGSSWVRSPAMWRTTRGSGPASMGSWKAGPAWPTLSPSMTRWSTQWIRERLWMLSAWTFVRALTLCPTASSWRN